MIHYNDLGHLKTTYDNALKNCDHKTILDLLKPPQYPIRIESRQDHLRLNNQLSIVKHIRGQAGKLLDAMLVSNKPQFIQALSRLKWVKDHFEQLWLGRFSRKRQLPNAQNVQVFFTNIDTPSSPAGLFVIPSKVLNHSLNQIASKYRYEAGDEYEQGDNQHELFLCLCSCENFLEDKSVDVTVLPVFKRFHLIDLAQILMEGPHNPRAFLLRNIEDLFYAYSRKSLHNVLYQLYSPINLSRINIGLMRSIIRQNMSLETLDFFKKKVPNKFPTFDFFNRWWNFNSHITAKGFHALTKIPLINERFVQKLMIDSLNPANKAPRNMNSMKSGAEQCLALTVPKYEPVLRQQFHKPVYFDESYGFLCVGFALAQHSPYGHNLIHLLAKQLYKNQAVKYSTLEEITLLVDTGFMVCKLQQRIRSKIQKRCVKTEQPSSVPNALKWFGGALSATIAAYQAVQHPTQTLTYAAGTTLFMGLGAAAGGIHHYFNRKSAHKHPRDEHDRTPSSEQPQRKKRRR